MDALRLDLTLPRRAFELELALELGPETVALVGPSGAGKTSVLRAVAGLERDARGTIACDGEVWLGPGVELRPEERSVGMLFQDPDSQIFSVTVEDEVSFGLENLGLGKGEMAARVEDSLGKVGLQGVTQTLPLAIYAEFDRNLDVAIALGALLVVFSAAILLLVKLIPRWTRSVSTSPFRAAPSSSS